MRGASTTSLLPWITATSTCSSFRLTRKRSSIASSVGRGLQEASESADLHTDLAAQAAALRDGISGVSLDEEAVYLLELQRAYQANARMVTVVSDLTQEILNLVG